MSFKKISKPTVESNPATKKMPVKSLAMREAGKDGLTSLCNLFEHKSKKGDTFLSGSNKDLDITVFVFTTKTGDLRLTSKENDQFVDICYLKETSSKAGVSYHQGTDPEGNVYNLFTYKPKEKK
jgi:hypothetical protein